MSELMLQTHEIQQGVQQLKQRQQKMWWLSLGCIGLSFTAAIALWYLQALVYGFFGLAFDVQQLHIPHQVDATLATLASSTDPFMKLLSWLAWLVFKLFSCFILAFVVLRGVKRIGFFARRLQGRGKRFLAWWIAFLLLWTGLSYWQNQTNSNEHQYAEITAYQQHISESELAQYLARNTPAQPVQAYLMAQTALLQSPPDRQTAIPYVLQLVKAEQQDPQFLDYGFSPEQLWTMQQQVYGKSLTPIARHLDQNAADAQIVAHVVKYVLWGTLAVSVSIALLLYVLYLQFRARILRIESQLAR